MSVRMDGRWWKVEGFRKRWKDGMKVVGDLSGNGREGRSSSSLPVVIFEREDAYLSLDLLQFNANLVSARSSFEASPCPSLQVSRCLCSSRFEKLVRCIGRACDRRRRRECAKDSHELHHKNQKTCSAKVSFSSERREGEV
jgi:hypothetical protein